MNRHERIQRLLLFSAELTPRQQTAVRQHTRDCAQCQEAALMIESNRAALGALVPLPSPALSPGAVRRLVPPARPPRLSNRARGLAAGLLLAAGAAILAAALSLGGHPATAVNAYTLLQRAVQAGNAPYPYSGTASISYAQIPWYLLPPEVADYAGRYRLSTRWWVRDATHFRVDVQIAGPPLERGSITAVLNGNDFTLYDARTRRATVLRGGAYRRLVLSPEELLALLHDGAAFGTITGGQAPTSSVSAYLASLRSDRSQPGIHPYARIVSQTRMLGRAVDVIDYGPLAVLSYDSGGCYPTTSAAPHATPVTYPPSGPCIHYRQPVGWGRVWITRDHPLILRFEEHGVTHIHNVLGSNIHYRYQVTSLHLGQPSPAAVLAYRPPVRPVVTSVSRFQTALVNTLQEGAPVTLPGFLPVADPPQWQRDNTRLATTTYGAEVYQPKNVAPPPWPFIPGMDVLFSRVRRWVKVYTSWHGQAGIYVTGPYVLVQERKLATGLPAPFSDGAAAAVGTCQIRTGRYWDGQRWLAFQRGGISVVVSSNAFSTSDLRRYAAAGFCH